MVNVFTEKAYAKVNFNLRVLPKRPDGFHDIESIFQTIDLFDELKVSVCEEPGCFVTCKTFDLPQQNTLTLAYQAFCHAVETDVPGVSVELIKGIPSGGGLGGGSSDAAALIRVLEKICGVKLTDQQLDYVAGKTGSDVFFFMHCDSEGKGCALVSGRGEYVENITPRTDLLLLLIFPNISSSTKEAYALVDDQLSKEMKNKYPSLKELEGIYLDTPSNWTFKNTFTPSLCDKYSDLSKGLCDLRKFGADYSDMTGSGSTLFGVFISEQQAFFCKNLLADTWNCKIVHLV